jgi:DNA polymerase I-like protein with 3'-5' exonuclease and polymerase domains
LLIKADASALEWRGAVFLSQDKVGIQEIEQGLDQHTHNQQTFGLPSRLIAKKFVFRLIYGGSAYSYYKDIEFDGIGNEKFWQGVIDKFYEKYYGLAKWHQTLLQTVTKEGRLIIPSGREYIFKQYPNFRGDPEWPRTQILNYPVQGFSADLMKLVRIAAFSRIKKKYPEEQVKFIATVHDDIELDVANDNEMCYNICIDLENVFKDIPKLFTKYFKLPFNVPMAGSVFFGPNLREMTEFRKYICLGV